MAKKTSPSQSSREKKRTLIRQHLHRLNGGHRDLRRLCADHIRAIRYLRLRNQEVAMLHVLLRLQSYMQTATSLQQQGQQQRGRNDTTIQLVGWKQPRD